MAENPGVDDGRPAGGRGAPRRVVSVALVVAVVGAATAGVVGYRRELWELFSAPEKLRAWVSAFGVAAPLVFVGLQALQVVVFVIPGEVPQIAGGYLFGALPGAALSVAGIAAGSAASFWLARALGVPFVRALFDPKHVERLRSLAASPRSRIVFFLLFVIPGIPKDILCYAAGLSSMRFAAFMFASLLGRLPGILGSAVMGNAAAGRKWVVAGVVGGGALVLFVVGYALRDRIARWLERHARRPPGAGGEGTGSDREPGRPG
jgi:uncharacterized membrane protein YdjX (TVP38/TMEM64 family)